MKEIPLVPCSVCLGKSVVPLSKVLLRTYRAIEALRECSIPEINKELGRPHTACAINRRVDRLVKLKLVSSFKPKGKRRFFRVATP